MRFAMRGASHVTGATLPIANHKPQPERPEFLPNVRSRRNAWLATERAFKIDADRTSNDCAQVVVLEIKAAIGDDEDNVRSPRAAKED